MRVAGFEIPDNTKCPQCHDRRANIHCLLGVLPCDSCVEKRQEKLIKSEGRRPLTDWERQKLSWYRNEKKWAENIKSRKIIFKNGQKTIVTTDSRGRITGELPKVR